MRLRAAALAFAACFVVSAECAAKTLCTIVADAATGETLIESGACRERTTPASTFKIPLAVTGFDSGFLRSDTEPTLRQRPNEPDWGGENWRVPITPRSWLKHSVVWYSQRIARDLGQDELSRYARAFRYGNADVSGDPGENNALERSWISSSLRISPYEQTVFLRALVNLELPVSRGAQENAMAIVEAFPASGGWLVHGKTGMAYPRNPDRSFDEAHAWGWFVGWADKDDRRVVFARLFQNERETDPVASLTARGSLLQDIGGLLDGAKSGESR